MPLQGLERSIYILEDVSNRYTRYRSYSQDNQLNKVAEGDVEQGADTDADILSHAFCRIRQEPRQGDDSKRVQRKDDGWVVQARHVRRYAKRHEDEQHIQPRSSEDVPDRERNGALILPVVRLLRVPPWLGLGW